MTLSEIRTLFIERSGRKDLVNADDSDNGANFFIQSGQRTLDRMLQTNKSFARAFKSLSSGDYYAIFKGCRAITNVWISVAGERWELNKLTLQEMRETYEESPEDVDTGESINYCVIPLRTYPDADAINIDYLYDDQIQDTETQDFEYKGIMFLPPIDESAILEVFGLFRNTALSDDADENFWTIMHPDVLIWAAMYHLEISYRNTEGANDWMNAVKTELVNIEMDFVDEESTGIDQLWG